MPRPLELTPEARSWLDLLPEPIWVFDTQDLRILWANSAACAWLEYTPAALTSKTILELRPTQDEPALRAALRDFGNDARDGGKDSGRWRLVKKSGAETEAAIHWRNITFETRPAILAAVKDVSPLSRMERDNQALAADGAGHLPALDPSLAEHLIKIAGEKVRLGAWRLDLNPERVIWTDETAAIHEMPPGTSPTLEEGLDYYTPEDRPRITASIRACAADGAAFDEVCQIKTATGRRIWVRALGSAVRNARDEVVAVQGAFQDITLLRAAEQRAKTADRQRLEVLENISDAFLTLDREWRFTYLNSRAEEQLAQKREDLLGKNAWAAFPEIAGLVYRSKYEEAVRTGKTVIFQEYFPPLDKTFDVSAYPVPEGLAVYFRDISAQKRAEESLRVNEERFRLIAKATNDVIWDWDLEKGTIWWNESVKVVFGYDLEGLNAGLESWTAHIHPDDRTRVVNSLHAVVDAGESTWAEEYRFIKADGAAATVLDRGFVIRSAAGKPVRMVGSMFDLTEQRDLERRLREAQKLEAVGQLTGGVAHDFNNLLTVIVGNTEDLVAGLGHDTHLRHMAEMTAKAAKRGAELTNRLLAFARRQTLQPKSVDVNHLVRGMQGLFRRTLSANIALVLACEDKLWTAALDPGQMEAALLNLVINARDAMPDGGTLRIETANACLDAQYAAAQEDLAPGDYIMVSITDTGTGMSPETLARVFEPFFTTKDVGKGSGLGLSMVFGFTKQSSGHIKIDSEPGKGTAVKLYFPRGGAQ